MKYCPVCDERFDEEIIKFCTKDGTPLVEEATPSFTALPSEAVAEDDIGEQTVIRRRPDDAAGQTERERLVIPTMIPDQQVRPRAAQAYYPPPPPPNTGKTVALTILGTLAVLGFGALLFWLVRGDQATSVNVNTNPPNINMNANLNSNVGFDSNFNFNTNGNFNSAGYNTNFNFNVSSRTPTATPTPRPSPSPTMTPRSTPEPTTAPSPRPTIDRPPTPVGTPRAAPSNRPANNGN